MKRFACLLLPLLLFMTACGSNTADVFQPTGAAEPGQDNTQATSEPAASVTDATDANAQPVDDPTAVRERDWKQGNTVDPAVTIIEYGDFQ